MAKSPAKKPTKGFEETLWDTANQLRGSVESSEYKHVVLSLVLWVVFPLSHVRRKHYRRASWL